MAEAAKTINQKILPEENKKYRLITRSDMDGTGLCCPLKRTEHH